MSKNILEVSNLQILDSLTGKKLVHDSTFQLAHGSCLGIVGESGSGKSLTCRAISRLNKAGLRQSGGIRLGEVQLAELSEREMRNIRGRQICMIVQNGMRAFDPSSVIGVHLRETLTRHFGWSRAEIITRMKASMESVMLKDPISVMNSYPHQLSGGMLQRVMIALALVMEPDVIIADEPTTALDTLSQFEVIEQFVQLRARIGSSVIFVTHDLGIVRKIADEVIVMKDGIIVEQGPTHDIFARPKHEYTRCLVSTRAALNQHFKEIMGGVSHTDC
ncbi:ABC transporter ATP-binding protein [Paenibacillus sp. YPG26]|uniref:staphylopine uptake ABC transporter ATP-binding protein CntD n=1 Tax=Paenibacillus sp. YPG26 TaxID=2878915 RepID=UPI00203D0FF1|nr:ABC transporter ATP-binding protein [Paenibacillus sp. YPG26]USB31761.1 ABC transporter ATP-binding protein [Paenibacillus sp. YPG26]